MSLSGIWTGLKSLLGIGEATAKVAAEAAADDRARRDLETSARIRTEAEADADAAERPAPPAAINDLRGRPR